MNPGRLPLLLAALVGGLGAIPFSSAADRPLLHSVTRHGQKVLIKATLPSGYRHVLLESRSAWPDGPAESLISGGLNGGEAIVTFNVPLATAPQFLRLRAGPASEVPPATYAGPSFMAITYLDETPLPPGEQRLHVLNRLAYGPSPTDWHALQSMGISAYLEQQLHPERIDESSNEPLQKAEAALFKSEPPREDSYLIKAGEPWRYYKGRQAPPAHWIQLDFDDAAWLEGPTGIGYGDDDDATLLRDMRKTGTQPGYASVFLRRVFFIPNPDRISQLIFRIDFDDGFVAYLNGQEIARTNLNGNPPEFSSLAASSHEAGEPVEYDLTSRQGLLRPGTNVLAIQVHNRELESSDLSVIPSLFSRVLLPGPPITRMKGIDELLQLPHLRGVYSRRQLAAVLAEFWDNHFTTDFDKVSEYFNDLRNSDATDAMSAGQADAEAAQVEFEEYQFWWEHGLGHFGDLLLYSATSPAMLIYLDSVLNRKGAANENYAREILELFAFGVDNRYTQKDIEELSRCFTGWSLRKIRHDLRPAFPNSARIPLTDPAVAYEDQVMLESGPGWRYFPGKSEPAADAQGNPTAGWAALGFDDRAWPAGSTSIGYGDNDDATVLSDMRGSYASVYLRREFTVAPGEDLEGLMFSAAFDDGYVAYLNGVEIARSETMEDTGTPPRHNRLAAGSHEANRPAELTNLRPYLGLIRRAPEFNVLAIQAHNSGLDSSDLSIHPRLIKRRLLPGSIEPGDPNGAWVFRFDPTEHDTGAKTIFAGTPHELKIPAGRLGADGAQDALEVIDAMVRHPSTREFICLKLINKFVSDDINLQSYRNGAAPPGLRRLLEEAMEAWMSTTPPGHIGTVLRRILRPDSRDGYFWSQAAYSAKVKTPIEFINSSLRALGALAASPELPAINHRLGMDLFTRDDPDGWSEIGLDWMDTGSLLERIRFIQQLAGNGTAAMAWEVDALIRSLPDKSADGIVSHFSDLLFQGHVSAAQRDLLIRFATTDEQGRPLPLDPARADYKRRLQELVALLLCLPQWHLQ